MNATGIDTTLNTALKARGIAAGTAIIGQRFRFITSGACRVGKYIYTGTVTGIRWSEDAVTIRTNIGVEFRSGPNTPRIWHLYDDVEDRSNLFGTLAFNFIEERA